MKKAVGKSAFLLPAERVVVFVLLLCLLLVAAQSWLQREQMQQELIRVRHELWEERRSSGFGDKAYARSAAEALKKARTRNALDDRIIRDLKAHLQAYEAAYPKPRHLFHPHSEPCVLTGKTR